MKKYDSYRDSGIEWLGEIPEHWENYRIDELANIVRGNTSFKRDELLENGDYVALQYGRVYNVDEVNSTYNYYINDDFYKSDQIVKLSDTILISTSETIEDLGHSCFYNRKDRGLLGGEQILLSPYSNRIIGKYLYYYSRFFCRELRKYATGIKVYRYNIFDLKQIKLPIPSIPEQSAIVQYLDTKTQAIDQKTSLLKKKIAYYKELRKSLINNTVTKSLDKNVVLKDSGIDWIGEIPEHWEVVRVKDVFDTLAGGTPSTKNPDYWIGKIPWIPSGNVQNNIVELENVSDYISELALKESSTKIAKKDSVLIALTGATCSNIGYLTFDTTINQSIVAISQRVQLEPKFYFYFLISGSKKIRTYMTGGAQGGINQEDVRFLKILLPPKQEQTAIARYLDKKTNTIDAIVSNIEAQIEKLQELRKTLINEVVTGKIKVA